MAQSVRERTNEIAVLKTLGYTKRTIAGLVLTESFVDHGARRSSRARRRDAARRFHRRLARAVLSRRRYTDLGLRHHGRGARRRLEPASRDCCRRWKPRASGSRTRCARYRSPPRCPVNSLAQIGAVTAMNLRNIPERLSSTLVALLGVMGVVTVVIGVLSINEGFRAVLQGSGADDVVVVLRGGATSEMTSGFGQTETRVIADAEQVARDGSRPIASSELYVIVDVPMKSTGTAAYVPLRGVSSDAATGLETRFRDHRGSHVHAWHVRDHRRPRRGHGVRGPRGRADVRRGHDGLERRGAVPRPRQRRRIGDLDRCAGAAGRLQPRHELPVRPRSARESAGVPAVQGRVDG